MSSATPAVVIVSTSNTKPKSLIKLITKNAFDASKCTNEDEIVQAWQIDTKYYTADIAFVGISENFERTTEFNENVEAVIVHIDTNKSSGLEDVKKWEKLEKECQPEVKILLANYCDENTKITKNKALDFCLRNGYELIELYPTQKEQDFDAQDIIEEKIGVERIIEALQAHVWSNLVMKDRNASLQPPRIPNEAAIYEKLQDVEVNDDFTELFSQLHLMKESLQSLPNQQRKQCAEQMVTAFWRAIGGDEEEI